MFNLIRFLIICALIYFSFKLIKWIFFSQVTADRDLPKHKVSAIKSEDLVEDPYCHTYVPMSQAYEASIEGQTIYFCSQKCFEKYIIENPVKKAREAL
jgi:YHS domain-containing protein